QDWDDLLDPRWRGRVLIRDPLASGTMPAVWGMVIERGLKATGDTAAGFQWLRRLDAQTKEYVLNGPLLDQKIARQEGLVTMWDLPDILLNRRDGLPLGYVFPESGTPVIEDAVAVVRGARHRDVARAFVEYVGSLEAQLLAAREAYRLPARLDVPADSLPAWARDVRRAAGRGPHAHRRGGRRRAVARAAALRHGVSALRLVSASRRGRERGVRAHGTREAGTGKREPQSRRGAGARGPARLRAAQSAGAVGRAAAARGAGARARPRAARAAARRAALEPRPGAAGAHTPRAASAHQARRDHDPLRDARAGGGLRPGRPGRGPRHGAARPGRDPGRPVRAPREPLRRHVRRSRQRIPRRGGAGIRRGGRPDRRSAPRGAAVLRDRDPGRGEGAALHRRRRVVPGGR